MNVGFREAMREEDWDCLFYHDVDLIPEDDRNTYVCDNHPKHAAIAMDKFGYKSVIHILMRLVDAFMQITHFICVCFLGIDFLGNLLLLC